MKVLVTGGAGYIGSTICSALLDAGHVPVILDSLSVGCEAFTRDRIFYKGDIGDFSILQTIFREHPDIYCVVHCAARILVPESQQQPHLYYKENVSKSNDMFQYLCDLNCPRVVFSSSGSLYDMVPNFMVKEDSPLNPKSPYARTKLMMEMILEDFTQAYGFLGISLRYFNPIGADPKMRSGIYVKNSTHVVPKLVDVALGNLPAFPLTGTTWPTRDGTGIRDYIHVWDLALAHVKAVEKFEDICTPQKPYNVINLGTGLGTTVRELIAAFERAYGQKIVVQEHEARPGDVAGAYANADVAKRLLGWETSLSVEEGIRHALEWGAKFKAQVGGS